MAKNHVAEVAKMLGLELGEEFEIETGNDSRVFGWCDRSRPRYRFTDHGFEKVRTADEGHLFDSFKVLNALNMLLSGMVEPIHCTKELKKCGLYYFLHPNGEVGRSTWYGSASDLALFNTGNCFLSMADADFLAVEDSLAIGDGFAKKISGNILPTTEKRLTAFWCVLKTGPNTCSDVNHPQKS